MTSNEPLTTAPDPTVTVATNHETMAAREHIAVLEAALATLVARTTELEHTVDRLRRAFDDSPVATVLVRLDPADHGRVLEANRSFDELAGAVVRPTVLAALLHADDVEMVLTRLQYLTAWPSLPMDLECRLVDAANATHVRLVAATTLPVPGPDGTQNAALVHIQDVTSHRAAIERANYVDGHDQLTGLVNRATLQDRLSTGLERTNASGSRLGLVLLDLDHFKVVNDALGHAAGDVVLLDVASRLAGTVREGDTVARLGGDEFAVLCLDLPGDAARASHELQRIAQRMLDAIATMLPAGDGACRVTASAGTRLSEQGDSAQLMLADADAAMYSAKSAGRRLIRHHEPSLRAAVETRHHLEHELRIALTRDELWVAYQPIVDLVSDRVVGAEALVRWDHPTLGRVMPDQFVPLAEATGLIVPLGEFVLQRVCSDLSRRPGWDAPGFHVAVNVSGAQLGRTDLADQVAGLLVEHELDPGRLRMELTETVLLDADEHVRGQLRRLADLGVGIDIDDFGTGYSSLTYLRQHPVTGIKVDRSFTAGLGARPDDEVIVAALLDLAANLGLAVVVEGVEALDQITRLRHLRCRTAQGYLFGRPGPAAELRPGGPLADEIRSPQVELSLS